MPATVGVGETKPDEVKVEFIRMERTPERVDDGQEKGSTDRKGASGSHHLKSVSA